MIFDPHSVLFNKLDPYLPPHWSTPITPSLQADDALAILVHLITIRSTLSAYLPRYLIDLILADPTPGRIYSDFRHGAVLLADISGFTAISEKLSALGKEGAEELSGLVNSYFEEMLNIGAWYSGDLLKFGGDALLLFFEGINGPQRAVVTGQAMQEVMQQRFSQVQTSQGVFPLQMKIGIGTGPILLATIGTAKRMEYTAMGRAISSMAAAEHLAAAGQIIVDHSTHQKTANIATFAPVDDDFWLLTGVTSNRETIHLARAAGPIRLRELWHDSIEILNQCLTQVAIIERFRPFVPERLFSKLISNPQHLDLLGSHRLVTLMFVHFYGIDEIIEALGPAHTAVITRILNNHFETMLNISARYGGVVNKIDTYEVGNRIIILFGALDAHEDDPQRSVRAALEMNEALRTVNQYTREILASIPNLSPDLRDTFLVQQRIGVNSGFAFVGNIGSVRRREYSVLGDEINLAARLMGAAQEGEILISQSVERRVRDEFNLQEKKPIRAKGKSEPVRNFVVIGERTQSSIWGNVTRGPMVGRDDELMLGREAVDYVVTRQGGRLLIIKGVSGIGKTRLAEEISTYGQAQGLELLAGQCLSYGQNTPYQPWLDIWRAYFGIRAGDDGVTRRQAVQKGLADLGKGVWAPIIGQALGIAIDDNDLTSTLEAKLRRQRLFDLTLELLQTRATARPLILVIENTHWADAASNDLISYIARNLADHPILIILPYRPSPDPDSEYLPWADYPHATHVTLTDLSDEASLEIARGMLGSISLPATLQSLIVQKGSGNPFFIEEMVRALISAGILQQDTAGTWQIIHETNGMELPDSIHGVIMSRIDRLLETDRQVLQVASVVGLEFSRHIVSSVYPYGGGSETIRQGLDYLSRVDLIATQSLAEETFRFRHMTTWEVVYGSLAFEQRRQLHQRIALFIENEFSANLQEQIDWLAYHYFEGRNWTKALVFGLLAAQHAQHEFANETAIIVYERVLEAAAKIDTETTYEQLAAHESLGEVLGLLGRYEEALRHYALARELVEVQKRQSPGQQLHLADLCRKIADICEKRSEFSTAFEWLEKALSYLDEAEPTVEATRCYIRGAVVYSRQARNDEAIEWCRRSLAIARKIKTREGQQAAAHAYYVLGGIYRLRGDLGQAVQFCLDSIRIYQQFEDIPRLADAYLNLSNAYSDQGNWAQGLAALQESLALKRKAGDIHGQGMIANNLAFIYLDRGAWDQATNLFEQSYSIWKQVGAAWGEAVVLSNLAQVHIYQERWPEAHTCLTRSQAIFEEIDSGESLAELERRWAEFYLKRGELEPALQHASLSVALAVAQGARLEEGMSRRLLGQVHSAQGDRRSAKGELDSSLRILGELNSEYEVARTRVELARLFLDSNPAVALGHLAQARKTFEEIGAQADLVVTRALEESLPAVQ